MNGVFEAAELCIERGHTHLISRCIVDAVEAYGRACRIAELRALCVPEGENPCRMNHRHRREHRRIAELEQEGG